MFWAAPPASAVVENPIAVIRPKARVNFFMAVTSVVVFIISGAFAGAGKPEPPDNGGHKGKPSSVDQECFHQFRSSFCAGLWLLLNSRSRLALETTVTDDNDMAAPARMGLIRMPQTG